MINKSTASFAVDSGEVRLTLIKKQTFIDLNSSFASLIAWTIVSTYYSFDFIEPTALGVDLSSRYLVFYLL